MRRASKIDDNQTAIVKSLRCLGYTVSLTANVGQGFPDLVVACSDGTWLAEVKDGDKSPSRQRLTPDQVKFHAAWPVAIPIFTSIQDVVDWHNQRRKE